MRYILIYLLTLFVINKVNAQQLQPSFFLTPTVNKTTSTEGSQAINDSRFFCNLYRGSFSINSVVLDTNNSNTGPKLMLTKYNNANQLVLHKRFVASNYIRYAQLLALHSYLYLQIDFNDTIKIDNQLFYNETNNRKRLVIKLDTNLNIVKIGTHKSNDYYNFLTIVNDSTLCSNNMYNQFIDTNLNIVHTDSSSNGYGGLNGLSVKGSKSYYGYGGYGNNFNNILPQFDTTTFQGPLPASGYYGNLLVKYNAATHQPIWATGLIGLNQNFNTIMGTARVAVDSKDQAILATGYTGSQLQFHDGSLLVGGGSIVVKYDTAGNILWKDACMYGDIYNVEVDTADNIYVCGVMNSTSSINNAFGGKIYNHGESGLFIGKYSPTGQELWSFVINNPIQKGLISGRLKVWAQDSFEVYGSYKFGSFMLDTINWVGNAQIYNGFYLAAKVVNGSVQITPTSKPNNTVFVYPNPASNNCNISYVGQPNSLQVYNALGQAVHTTKPLLNTTTIATSAWPNGIYTIQLGWPNGTISTTQFMHQ